MLEALQIGVAAWVVFEAIRAVTPIPTWTQYVVVLAACYGLTFAPPVLLTVLHAAAVVSMLGTLASILAVPRRVELPPRERKRKPVAPGRVPPLP